MELNQQKVLVTMMFSWSKLRERVWDSYHNNWEEFLLGDRGLFSEGCSVFRLERWNIEAATRGRRGRSLSGLFLPHVRKSRGGDLWVWA